MDLETSNIYPVGNIYLKLLKLSLFGWKWFAKTTQSSALNSCKIKKKKKKKQREVSLMKSEALATSVYQTRAEGLSLVNVLPGGTQGHLLKDIGSNSVTSK